MSNEEKESSQPDGGKSRQSQSRRAGTAKNAQPEIRYVPLDIRAIEGDSGDQIDLIELVKTVWDGRKIIYKTLAVFLVLGLIVALGSGVEYTSQVRVLPEYLAADQARMSGLGGLGGLAQQFGVNIGSSQTYDAIPPRLYPDVTQSVTFMQELMEYEVSLPENPGQTVPLETYFLEHYPPSFLSYVANYTIYLPFTILRGVRSLFNGEEEPGLTAMDQRLAGDGKAERIVQMTPQQWQIVYMLRERVSAIWNVENTSVTVSVKMPDPIMAADLADQVVQLLTGYITEYRTEKMRQDLEFVEERYREAERRFLESQKALAAFNDQNRGQLTALARTEEQLLQSRYDLTFGLYNSLAQRLEQAQLKLQEETPVMNVLDKAAVPDRKSEPRRIFILIISLILGGLTGIGICFCVPYIYQLRSKINQS